MNNLLTKIPENVIAGSFLAMTVAHLMVSDGAFVSIEEDDNFMEREEDGQYVATE